MQEYRALKNERVKLREVIPLNTPFTLFVDPTNCCNFKCSFCPRNNKNFIDYAGEFQHMTMDIFLKIIHDIKEFPSKLKVLRLFYLGEPLLCPDFLKMLHIAVVENIAQRIEISTNASLLTDIMSNKILDIAERYQGDLYLRFSIYSVSNEKNKKITKSNIDIKTIYNNIRTMQELRDKRKILNVKTYAKMMDSFDDENFEFLNMYQKIVDEIEIEQPMNWSGDEKLSLLSSTYTAEQIQKVEKKDIPNICAYPFHTMAIQSDGDVVCCCVDWSRKTRIGNVKEESLIDIWNGERLRQFRRLHLRGDKHLNDACQNCKELPAGGVYSADNLEGVSPDILG